MLRRGFGGNLKCYGILCELNGNMRCCGILFEFNGLMGICDGKIKKHIPQQGFNKGVTLKY